MLYTTSAFQYNVDILDYSLLCPSILHVFKNVSLDDYDISISTSQCNKMRHIPEHQEHLWQEPCPLRAMPAQKKCSDNDDGAFQ